MKTKRDIASIIAPFFVTYVARDLGTVDVGKLICSFEKTLISTNTILIFKKEIYYWTDSTS